MKKAVFSIIVLCFCLAHQAATVETLVVTSGSMAKKIKNSVVLPKAYLAKGSAVPVLFLLHGAGGDYTDWITEIPEIKAYADQYRLMIICPDGGRTSWYFDSPVDKRMKYETYVSRELVNAVDGKYNVRKERSGRAIAGLSMGGHGAFYLAFRHQDVWGAAGSMSGGVDFRPFPEEWDIAKRLGPYSRYPGNWERNTVTNMLHLLTGGSLKLIFDCGTEDFFYIVNRNLHLRMLERNIPHDYIERPGGHTAEYWRNAIQYQLLFFAGFFKGE